MEMLVYDKKCTNISEKSFHNQKKLVILYTKATIWMIRSLGALNLIDLIGFRVRYGISVSGDAQDLGRSPRRCCRVIAGTMAQTATPESGPAWRDQAERNSYFVTGPLGRYSSLID